MPCRGIFDILSAACLKAHKVVPHSQAGHATAIQFVVSWAKNDVPELLKLAKELTLTERHCCLNRPNVVARLNAEIVKATQECDHRELPIHRDVEFDNSPDIGGLLTKYRLGHEEFPCDADVHDWDSDFKIFLSSVVAQLLIQGA
jgi:hypothetical protein